MYCIDFTSNSEIVVLFLFQVYKCNYCDFTANSKLAITNHARKRHPISEEPAFKVCQIQFCNFKAKTQSQMDTHMKKCHEKKKSKKISNPSPTKSPHGKNSVKSKRGVGENFDSNFSCSICSATFIREDSYKSHMRQHQLRKEFIQVEVNSEDLAKNSEPTTVYAPLVGDYDKMIVQESNGIQYVIVQDIIDTNNKP